MALAAAAAAEVRTFKPLSRKRRIETVGPRIVSGGLANI